MSDRNHSRAVVNAYNRMSEFLRLWREEVADPSISISQINTSHLRHSDLELLLATRSPKDHYPAIVRFAEVIARWEATSVRQTSIIARLSARLTEIRRISNDPNATDEQIASVVREVMNK